MMLGKRRQRPPMNRTTSMTEFTLDLSNTNISVEGGVVNYPQQQQFDPHNPFLSRPPPPLTKPPQDQPNFLAPSPRRPAGRRHSADFLETSDHFLRACSLCKRNLIPGRDIFMYRGDSAFCSLECRQQQVNQDERKERCSLVSKKEVSTTATGSDVSSSGETVAAV